MDNIAFFFFLPSSLLPSLSASRPHFPLSPRPALSPQNFDLFLPAVLQCLAAAGPHCSVLRLAGGKYSPGGVSGRCAQCGHFAAGCGDGRSLLALRLLTAGKSKTSC